MNVIISHNDRQTGDNVPVVELHPDTRTFSESARGVILGPATYTEWLAEFVRYYGHEPSDTTRDEVQSRSVRFYRVSID